MAQRPLVVIGAVSYLIPRIGVAASITTIVAGQLLVGTLLDHFGLLGAAERSLDPTRILGLADGQVTRQGLGGLSV